MSSFTKLLLARTAKEHSKGTTPLQNLLILREMIENQARADERRGDGRGRGPAGADVRLPGRLLGRRRDRGRGCARVRGSRPQGRARGCSGLRAGAGAARRGGVEPTRNRCEGPAPPGPHAFWHTGMQRGSHVRSRACASPRRFSCSARRGHSVADAPAAGVTSVESGRQTACRTKLSSARRASKSGCVEARRRMLIIAPPAQTPQ